MHWPPLSSGPCSQMHTAVLRTISCGLYGLSNEVRRRHRPNSTVTLRYSPPELSHSLNTLLCCRLPPVPSPSWQRARANAFSLQLLRLHCLQNKENTSWSQNYNDVMLRKTNTTLFFFHLCAQVVPFVSFWTVLLLQLQWALQTSLEKYWSFHCFHIQKT